MAEKTEEHKKLIVLAKELGVKSPHLFGLPKLKEKIEEAKRIKEDAPANTADTPPAAAPVVDGSGDDDAGAGTTDEAGDGDQDETPTEDTTDTASEDSDVKVGNGYLYHETEKPRVFLNGETIPEGWNMENRACWKVLDTGKYVNVNG